MYPYVFLVPLDTSEVPALLEPVCLLLKFRFHVKLFQLFLK
jgi:hypothetical protein